MPKVPEGLSFLRDQFSQHPQSVAERRADRRNQSCPLVADWKRWDIFVGRDDDFRQMAAADQARSDAARQAQPIAHSGRLKLAWCAAADSDIGVHTPDHIHAETTVDQHHVHIDRIERHRHSPGRSLMEVRIFVDGVLAGRAGGCGCSLGAGGHDLPAVARLGLSRAITVNVINDIAVPIVELWRSRHDETTGSAGAGFEECRARLTTVLNVLVRTPVRHS